MSRNNRSGFNSLAALTASKPLAHSATTSMSAWADRYSRISARAGASSSMMMAVKCSGSFKGHTHFGDIIAVRLAYLQLCRAGILGLQALPHQHQTETRAPIARTVRIAGIADPDAQRRLLQFAADRD